MGQKIRVDRRQLDLTQEEGSNGVRIRLIASPYDIPESVSAEYSENEQKLVISFEYLADETCERFRHNSYVEIEVGKRSDRIHKVIVDVNSIDAEEVAVAIEKNRPARRRPSRKAYSALADVALATIDELSKLADSNVKHVSECNAKLARQALEINKSSLEESLAIG